MSRYGVFRNRHIPPITQSKIAFFSAGSAVSVIIEADGNSTGSSSVLANGCSFALCEAISIGTAADSSIACSIFGSLINANGISEINGYSVAFYQCDAESSGQSSVDGYSVYLNEAIGSGSGESSSVFESCALFVSDGASLGESSCNGIGITQLETTGLSIGSSGNSISSNAIWSIFASASGTSVVTGYSFSIVPFVENDEIVNVHERGIAFDISERDVIIKIEERGISFRPQTRKRAKISRIIAATGSSASSATCLGIAA